jgi:hypothetical protein
VEVLSTFSYIEDVLKATGMLLEKGSAGRSVIG